MSLPEFERDGETSSGPRSRGLRRLPIHPAADAADVVSADPVVDVPDLRAVFADELDALAKETRDKALADGRAIAEQALAAKEKELKARLHEDFAKRLQEQQDKLETQLQRLISLADDLEAQRKTLSDSMIPTVTRLSMAVVLRMLGTHAASRSLVADLARQAINEYSLEGVVRIRVSQEDFQAMSLSEDDEEFAGLFQVDTKASSGDCLVDFGLGVLDAGLDTQLSALRAVLIDAGGRRVGND